MKKYFYSGVLIVTIGVGVALMYSIWGAVAPRSAQQFLDSGKQFFEQRKYPEATVEFLNALQKDISHREARFLLARTYLAQNDLDAAMRQLRSLLEYYPDDIEANLQLGNIYLQGGNRDPQFFRAAKELAEKVLAKEPKNILGMVLLGNSLAGLRNFTSSIEQFEQALQLDPQNAATLVSLGTAQAFQKNYAEAEQTFLKARAIDPKSLSALISLAGYYTATGKVQEAENMYKEALAAYPDNRQVYLPAMIFYLNTGRLEPAIQVLKDAQAKGPTDPGPSLLLVSVYRANKRPADARTLLDELKAKFPENDEVALTRAEVLFATDRVAARKEVDAMLKKEPSNVPAQVLMGEFQFFEKQYDEAAATLGPASIINGRYPQAHLILGQISVYKGQTDKALEHFQKALEINSAYNPARLALAEVLLRTGRIADAGVEAQKALATDPKSVAGRLVRASVNAMQGKLAEAEQEFTALQKELPDDASVQLRTGMYYQLRGRNAEAEKNLLRALQLQPDSDDVLRQVVQYFDSQKATNRAIDIINTTVPDSKKRALHYEMAGVIYARASRLPEAEAAFKKALQMEPDRVESHANLANVYIGLTRYDDALKQIDELLKQVPNNANAYSMKGVIYQTKEDLASAKDNYERALKVDPNSFVAANNLAYILAEQGKDLEVALGYAQTARRLGPDQPASADTLGWIQYKMGRHVSARDQLQFAVSKQPENPTFQYHLGMVYKETKQIPQARAALQKAIGSKENFKEKSLAEAALKEIR
jgi:tetratricopeptide (TPR) repeat protein